MFSDGLLESHDEAGQQLEADGLRALVGQARAETSDLSVLVRRTLALARERAVDWERDDITLIAVAYPQMSDKPTDNGHSQAR
jgi:serine phosphatase RsbU (regulator of sigma subunit)